MLKRKKLSLLYFLLFFSLPSLAERFKGPCFSKNQVLNQFIFSRFYPLRASIAGSPDFIADISHSNVIRARLEEKYETWSDYELTHLTLNPFFKIGKKTELSFNFGVLSYWGGFLDRFVEQYHTAFGFPNGQRQYVTVNSASYKTGTANWKIVDRERPTTSFRDSSVMLRYGLLKTGKKGNFRNFALTLAAMLEYPTGRVHLGTSNGSLDYGGALYMEKEFIIPEIYLYYMGSLIKQGRYKDALGEMPVRKVASQHSLSWEFLAFKIASFVLQFDYSDSAYKNTDNTFYNEPIFLLVTGLNFALEKQLLQLSFTEDLSHKTTPDFTLQLTYFYKF